MKAWNVCDKVKTHEKRSEDYDIDNLGSYDTLREAIEEAQKRLNMEVGEIDTKQYNT